MNNYFAGMHTVVSYDSFRNRVLLCIQRVSNCGYSCDVGLLDTKWCFRGNYIRATSPYYADVSLDDSSSAQQEPLSLSFELLVAEKASIASN